MYELLAKAILLYRHLFFCVKHKSFKHSIFGVFLKEKNQSQLIINFHFHCSLQISVAIEMPIPRFGLAILILRVMLQHHLVQVVGLVLLIDSIVGKL